MLGLSVDEVLATTRAVRKRLDFSRPVEPRLIMECWSWRCRLQHPNPKVGGGWSSPTPTQGRP